MFFIRCVTFGKKVNLSEPLFHICKIEMTTQMSLDLATSVYSINGNCSSVGTPLGKQSAWRWHRHFWRTIWQCIQI